MMSRVTPSISNDLWRGPVSPDDPAAGAGEAAEGKVVGNPPPDGGKRAWLIVLACCFMNLCISMVTVMLTFSTLTMANDESFTKRDEYQEYILEYNNMVSLCAPLASIFMTIFGYRPTAVVGSAMMALAFLCTSFMDEEVIKLMGAFLVGLGGLGAAFAKFASLIPIQEYFKTKRLRALVLYYLAGTLGSLAGTGVFFISGVSWQTTLRALLGPTIAIGLAGLTLEDLNPTYAEAPGKPSMEKVLRLLGLDTLKKGQLYMVLGVFFIYELGMSMANERTLGIATNKDFEGDKLIAFVLVIYLGSLLGEGWTWLWSKLIKDVTMNVLRLLFLVVMVMSLLAGISTIVVTPIDAYGVYVTFAIGIGFCVVYVEGYRDDALPDMFGQDSIKTVEALLGLVVGVAGVVASALADEIEEHEESGDDGWKNSFYLAGSFLLLTAALVLALFLLECVEYQPGQEPGQEGQQAGRAPGETPDHRSTGARLQRLPSNAVVSTVANTRFRPPPSNHVPPVAAPGTRPPAVLYQQTPQYARGGPPGHVPLQQTPLTAPVPGTSYQTHHNYPAQTHYNVMPTTNGVVHVVGQPHVYQQLHGQPVTNAGIDGQNVVIFDPNVYSG